MLSKKLKQVLALANKTGDRVVIFDGSDEENSYLITSLDKYLAQGVETSVTETEPDKGIKDKLEEESEDKQINLDSKKTPSLSPKEPAKSTDFKGEKEEGQSLTEKNLTDRINQEISIWKNKNEANLLKEEEARKKSWQIPPAVKKKAHDIE